VGIVIPMRGRSPHFRAMVRNQERQGETRAPDYGGMTVERALLRGIVNSLRIWRPLRFHEFGPGCSAEQPQ
jgi:hypothetical protein